MRVAETEIVSQQRGVHSSAKFGMIMNRHSVQTMIGKLYQDQIKAIIRELSTNAVDAHIDAGTLDTPFTVHIPNGANREFKIRDYGTGMSQVKIMGKPGVYREESFEHDGKTVKSQVCLVEPVMGLYNTFFDSDKRTSDEKNGCFGLGSKSPLGYCDSFSVTSFYGGEKKIYIVGFDTEGLPVINLMHSEPTDEPTGLEVAFQVKANDCTQFELKAKEVYTYFKYRPTFIGQHITIPNVTYRLESDDKTWGIAGGKSIATMGHIAYPIDSSHFSTKVGDVHPNAPSRYRDGYGGNEYQRVLSTGIHLSFDIGELEMTPSRESLQYTKRTIDAIKAKLDKVINEITDLVSRRFKNAKNLWEAKKLYVNLMSGELEPIKDMVHIAGVKWNGKTVNDKVNFQAQVNGVHTNHILGTDITKFSGGGSYSNRVHRSENPSAMSVPSIANSIVFVENDIARGAYVGCRRLLIGQNVVSSVYLLNFADNAAKDTFCEVMGFDSSYIVKASTLPKPVRVKGQVSNEKVFVFSATSGYGNAKDFWTAEQVDMEDGGIYAEINHFELVKSTKDDRLRPRDLYSIINKFKNLGITPEPIVGVKSAVAEKFKNYEDADWVNVFDYLKALLDVYVKKNNLVQIITDIHTLNSFRELEKYNNIMDRMAKCSTVTPLKNWNKPFGAFLTKLKVLIKNRDLYGKKVQDVLDLAQLVGYNLGSGKAGNLSDEEKDILDKYEFLKLPDAIDMHRQEKVTVVINLVNQFDK